jgi:hypothetical protein
MLFTVADPTIRCRDASAHWTRIGAPTALGVAVLIASASVGVASAANSTWAPTLASRGHGARIAEHNKKPKKQKQKQKPAASTNNRPCSSYFSTADVENITGLASSP